MRLICSAILALALSAVASAADKSNGGLAVSVGIGDQYGGDAGCGFEYQLRLAPRFRLTPFAAAGVVGGTSNDSLAVGYCGGVNVEYGRWHRVLAGVSFGSHYRDSDSLPPAKARTMIGPALCLGYKGTASFGLVWQVYGGIAHIVNPVNNPNRLNTDMAPAFGLGLGYKF